MKSSDNVREMLEMIMPDVESRANMIRSLSFLLMSRLTEAGHTDVSTVLDQYYLVEGLVTEICGKVPELEGASDLLEKVVGNAEKIASLKDTLDMLKKRRDDPSKN